MTAIVRDKFQRQKTQDIGRGPIRKPGITQPAKDQIGIHIIAPRSLAQ